MVEHTAYCLEPPVTVAAKDFPFLVKRQEFV